ncbi:MAG: hypothetical protein IJQ59_05855 [Bacteroidaceae bacterium]|nr:hypothetical protein [Bacteroidaceae bacterium]
MEFGNEKMKQLVDKINGLREDMEELEGVMSNIINADKDEKQDWLEVYLRDQTATCALLTGKRDFINSEIARLARELCRLLDD